MTSPGVTLPKQPARAVIFTIIIIAFMLLVCLPLLHAQAANAIAISNQIMQPNGYPAQSATVAVCPITAIGTPCDTTGVQLYADPNLIAPITDPVSTDQYGNYAFFTTTGAYMIQVTPSGSSGPTYVYYDIQGSGLGGQAPPFNVVTTGENTTATMTLGPGAQLTYVPGGIVNASEIGGITVSGSPQIGYALLGTSTTTAMWQPNTIPLAASATNLAGGSLGSAPYQNSTGSTTFILSPTTAGVYLYSWQPSGGPAAPLAATPATLQLASLAASAGTQAFGSPITAPTVNGIALSTTGLSSQYLSAAGTYTTPGSPIGNVPLTIAAGTQPANSCTPIASPLTLAGVATTAPGNLVLWGYSGSTSGLTGWGGAGGMRLHLWPAAANTIIGEVCNQTATSLAYSAITVVVSAK